jgi:hypothetical protein
MTKVDTLSVELSKLGHDLVTCNRACAGIVCDRTTGQVPRSLYLEIHRRLDRDGAAVVGLNPGRSTVVERQFYLDRGCTYDSVVSWYTESGTRQGLNHPYYRRLRNLVDDLGLEGPILWTELAKCESEADTVDPPPLQTFRTCTGAFLERELALIPPDWPLFAVGREAYRGLADRFPTRTVIGVPHPTGSRGEFAGLFDSGRLRESAAREASDALSSTGQAVWLVA